MRSQVVVWSEKLQMATAVHILGKSRDNKKLYIIELKYCSHSTSSLKRCYKMSHPSTPRLRGMNLANSLFNHHQFQLRATVKLFKSNYNVDKKTKLIAGIIVACADGGVLFYGLRP